MRLDKRFKLLLCVSLVISILTSCGEKSASSATDQMIRDTVAKVTLNAKLTSKAAGRSCVPDDNNPDPDEFEAVAKQILVSGTGEPDATIEVTNDGYNICTAKVFADSNWTCGLITVSGNGEHLLKAQQKIDSKVTSTDKVKYRVKQEDDEDDPVDKGGDGTDGHGGGTDCNRGGGSEGLPYQIAPLSGDGGLLEATTAAAAAAAAAGVAGAGSAIAGAIQLGFTAFTGLFGAGGGGAFAMFSFMHSVGGGACDKPEGSAITSNFAKGSPLASFTVQNLLDTGIKLVAGNTYCIKSEVYKNGSTESPYMSKTTPFDIPPESGIPASGSLSINNPKESSLLPYNTIYVVSGYDDVGAKVTVKASDGNILCNSVPVNNYKQWSCSVPDVFIKNTAGPVKLKAIDDRGQSVSVDYVVSVAQINIRSPYSGEVITSKVYKITGTGESGAMVVVRDKANEICNAPITGLGVWTCSSSVSDVGEHIIYAVTQINGKSVGVVESVTFSIAKGVFNSLNVTYPAEGSTVASSPYYIQGTASPNESISVTGIPGVNSCDTYSSLESGLWQCGPYKANSTKDVTITVTMPGSVANNYARMVRHYFLRPAFTVESPQEGQIMSIFDKDYYIRGLATTGSLVLVQGLVYIKDCNVTATNGKWQCGPYPLELGDHRIKVSNFKNSNDEAKKINLNAPIIRRFASHYPFTIISPTNGGSYMGSVTPNGSGQSGANIIYSFDGGLESGVATVTSSYWQGKGHLLAKGTHTLVASQMFESDLRTNPPVTFTITQNDQYLFTLGTKAPPEGSYSVEKFYLDITDGTGYPGDSVRYKLGCFDTALAMQNSDCSKDFDSDQYDFGPITITNQGLWSMTKTLVLLSGRYTFKAAEFDPNNHQVGRTIERNFTVFNANNFGFGKSMPADNALVNAPYTLNMNDGVGQAGLTVRYRILCYDSFYSSLCQTAESNGYNLGPVDISQQGWSMQEFADMPAGSYGFEAKEFSKDGKEELNDTYRLTTFTVVSPESAPLVDHDHPVLIQQPANNSTITTNSYKVSGVALYLGSGDVTINVYYVNSATGLWEDKLCGTRLNYNGDNLPISWSCDSSIKSVSGNFSIRAHFGDAGFLNEHIASNTVNYTVVTADDSSIIINTPEQSEVISHYPGDKVTISGNGQPGATVGLELTNTDTGSSTNLTGASPLVVTNLGAWSGDYFILGKVGYGSIPYSLTATQQTTAGSVSSATVEFGVHCMQPNVDHGQC